MKIIPFLQKKIILATQKKSYDNYIFPKPRATRASSGPITLPLTLHNKLQYKRATSIFQQIISLNLLYKNYFICV